MSLLAALPMAALTLDQDLVIDSAEPVFLDLLGHREADVIGRSFDGLVLSSQREPLAELVRSEAQHSIQLDLSFISARGGSLPARISVTKRAGASTATRGLLAVTLEKLDRGFSLRQAARIDEALSLAKVANWELEIGTGRILASRSWHALWGLESDGDVHLGQALARVHEEDRAQLAAALRAAIDGPGSFHLRFRILRPDRRTRWIECTGRRHEDDTSPTGRLYGAMLDITEQQDAAQALARYAEVVAAIPDRIALVDPQGQVLTANPAFLEALGRTYLEVIDQPLRSACGDGPLADLLDQHLEPCLTLKRERVAEIRERGADGKERYAEARLSPHLDDFGRATSIVVKIRDVTELRDTERRLLESAAACEATSEGVLITDASGTIISANAAFTQITGYAESEVLGQKPNLLSSHWHSRGFFVGMWRRLLRQGVWQGEIWNRRKDGEVYRQRLSIRRVVNRRGAVTSFVGVFAEPDNLPETAHRAEHLIHYDPLTKLPNRLLFDSRLEHAIELSSRKESGLALFILDLDHFSHINSSLGHQIGDDLLRAVTHKLREAIRPADTLARLRADQFGLVFEEVGDRDEVTEIARRLQQAMRAPLWVRSHLLHVNVSMGIALSAQQDDVTSMLTKAEAALRQVKRQGRNGFQISTAEPDDAQAEQQRLIALLRNGKTRGDFQLLFRPGIELHGGQCDYVEAFVQWSPPELGPVPQERFIALAQDAGLVIELGDWALDQLCRQLQSWLSRRLPLPVHGLRVHEIQLTQGDLVRKVANVLADYPRVAALLTIEVSETLLSRHREQVAEVFQGLNRLGVSILVGDVGIGWTAPAILQRLPIKTLKIDASFISALPGSAHELAVVEAVIAMAQALHLQIRADGVNTKEQQYQLMTLGCHSAQGDMISEPLTAARLEDWLAPKESAPPPQSPRTS